MAIRPIDISRKLGISTTTLRKYEKLGLVPPVPRSESGYRIYSEVHVAYYICIREMINGFTLKCILKIMKEVMAKRIESAYWIVNRAQADLRHEKIISEKMIKNLNQKNNPPVGSGKELLTINDVSMETGVPTTTIRYWEKAGLLSVARGEENNYRLFTTEHIRQISAIYALKFLLYSKYQRRSIERIKEELKEFDYNDNCWIEAVKKDFRRYLDRANRGQIKGIAALYHLCTQVEAGRFEK